MTHNGKTVTLHGETSETPAPEPTGKVWWCRNLFRAGGDDLIKRSHQFEGGSRVAELISDRFYFRHTSGMFPPHTALVLAHGAPFINLAFCISGSRHYSSSSTRQTTSLKQHQHNLFYFPEQRLQLEWPQGEQVEFFDIYMSTERFFRYLPQRHPLAISFRTCLEQGSSAQLSSNSLPLTPRLISLLYELLNCQISGHCKCMFTEAKVVELLALQLDQQGHLPAANSSVLKLEEEEKMQLAKSLLLANLEAPLSLKDLAHQVGTNEFSLKKHFKEVFGATVFGYLHQHRMEQSRELLLQGNIKIADLAQQMGYKHATHFASAFKKHFGFSPAKLKVN